MTGARASSYASTSTGNDLEWVNAIVRGIWPKASRGLLLYLREFLEPAIRHNMPSYLPAVTFTRLDLGTIPPVVTSVSVRNNGHTSVEASGQHELASLLSASSSNGTSVILELGITFDGNTNFQMALASSSSTAFGIESAHLNGRLEVIVAPVISRIPLFGAFQVAFINAPVIDFTLTGIAAAGDMGPWTGAFRRVVQDIFGSIAVLPNRIVVRIDPAIDFFSLSAMSHAVGVLRVSVLEGKGFPHTDTNTIKQSLGQSSEPDVYVTLRLGNITYQTVRIDDCESPKYENQIFDFILTSNSPDQQLHIEAFDFDLGQDDKLGQATVQTSKLLEAPTTDVRLKNSPMGAIPKVKLAARFLPLSNMLQDVMHAVRMHRLDKSRPSTCSTLMLAIAIDKAFNLPGGCTTRPFVRVLLAEKQILQTWNACNVAGLLSTENPVWEFSRHVLVKESLEPSAKVTFEVRDGASSKKVMGKAFLLVADLMKQNGCRKSYNFAMMGATRPDACLRVCVGLEAIVSTELQPLWNPGHPAA